jgi:hypothetical protein
MAIFMFLEASTTEIVAGLFAIPERFPLSRSSPSS